MRLKQLRKKANMTQTALALELKVAQNTLSNWENGNRLMDSGTAARVAKYFNVSIDYLLGDENNSDMRTFPQVAAMQLNQLPNYDILCKLASLLRTSPEDLVSSFLGSPPLSSDGSTDKTGRAQRFAYLLSQLTEEDMDQLDDYVQFLASRHKDKEK